MEETKHEHNRAQRATALAAARQAFWNDFPRLIEAMIQKGKEGDVAHLKLLLELCGAEKGLLAARRGRKLRHPVEHALLDKWAAIKAAEHARPTATSTRETPDVH